jgi:hypothetical protein
MSFVTKYIKSAKANRLNLVLTKTKEGQPAWWYVLVDAPKLDAFYAAMESGGVDLADYGKIVKSGYGEEPPRVIKDQMKEEFGFEEAN